MTRLTTLLHLLFCSFLTFFGGSPYFSLCISWKMGWGQSKKYLPEADLSDPESDSEWFRNSSEMQSDSEERTDAVLRNLSPPYNVLTLESVQNIEKELDNFEIVSLVYLLYDTIELALQDLQRLVATGMNDELLYKWAKSEDYKHKRWQTKLVEALCIVQNYQILKKMGYNKVDLKADYMPRRAETSCCVNRTRKAFYLIAEKLGKDQTTQFIHNMRKILRERQIPAPSYAEDYLEIYFLYWEQSNLNIEDIKNTFKVMDLEQYYDMLNFVTPSENSKMSSNVDDEVNPKLPKMVNKIAESKSRKTSTTRDTTYLQPGSLDIYSMIPQAGTSGISEESLAEDVNRYSINPDNPGVVLIINQEDFFTEPDSQYKDLLHKDNDIIKLDTRDGTKMDKTKLEHVFRKLGFKIKVRENLPHYDIIKTIRDVTMEISDESSLIVCVLSHGDNGVVYGANSCKVDVNQIQNIICKKNKKLLGKPKVLILQSCQGKQCQKIEEESSENEDEENANAKDGPSTVPSTADLLTFWATIPGFAAIRNVKKGSWLIQELCDEIEESSPRFHFLDICTRAVNKVTSRVWKEKTGINIMTPMVVTTLRKAFYLPVPRNRN